MPTWSARTGVFATARSGFRTIPDTRQRQLTRMGNAAYGAGLAHLMLGDQDAAGEAAPRRRATRISRATPMRPREAGGG